MKVLFKIFLIFVLQIIFLNGIQAQNTQSIETGPSSVLSTNTGPSSSVEIELFHNSNNPTDDNFSVYRPTLTATVSFTNIVGDPFVSQDTNNNNSGIQDPSDDNPPVILGWNYSPTSPPEPDSDGAQRSIVVDYPTFTESYQTAPASGSIYTSQADYEALFSSLTNTLNDGISFDVGTGNYGVFIEAGFEGLGINGETYVNGRHRLSTMTITFNQPVTNPILHFFGLGSFWFYDDGDFEGGSGTRYFNAASAEFDLESSIPSGATLSKLSGNDGLGLGNGSQIVNTKNVPDVIDTGDSDSGVAHGSIQVLGDDLTSITFTVYGRAIEDPTGLSTSNFIVGDEDFGWNGQDFTFGAGEPDTYNFASDLFHLGISTQVDPNETLLTTAECYRMLTSPIEGATYADLVGDFWIQGENITGTGVNVSNTGVDPNIFLWPTNASGANTSDWTELPDMDDPIDPGTGFLISVFEDDNFETPAIDGGFDKTISVTGSENAPLTVNNTNGMNTTAEGWSLLGNPFKSPIAIQNDAGSGGAGSGLFQGNTANVVETVYIWDRNNEAGDGGDQTENPPTDPDGLPGSWITGTSAGTGDIFNDDGTIAPFQGFFVQNTSGGGTNSAVEFRDASKVSGTGTFYGKDASSNKLRLLVTGESLHNSMWLQFSNQGSYDSGLTDALELMPLSFEYAMLGSKKSDETIFDIAHFPIPNEELEIPVSLETTRSGRYTLTATDFDISFGQDLYLVDLDEEKSIRIDENFEYTFTVSDAAKVNSKLRPCNVSTGPQKAQTVAATDRFLITTQPKEFGSELPTDVALNQNYPNPFNPTTQITYQLPQQSDVRLQVFDMAGRQVATLVNESVNAGTHTVNFDASSLSSGVYLYKLQAGSTVLTRKLTLIK